VELAVAARANGAPAGIFVTALKGLGVAGAPDGARLGKSAAITEELRFVFGPGPVRVTEIRLFDFGTGASDTAVSLDLILDGTTELSLAPLGDASHDVLILELAAHVPNATDFIGSTLAVVPTVNGQNGFFVSAITVEALAPVIDSVQGVALAEPAPATRLAFGLGIMTMILAGWRTSLRRRAATAPRS